MGNIETDHGEGVVLIRKGSPGCVISTLDPGRVCTGNGYEIHLGGIFGGLEDLERCFSKSILISHLTRELSQSPQICQGPSHRGYREAEGSRFPAPPSLIELVLVNWRGWRLGIVDQIHGINPSLVTGDDRL